jgi:hypothetical protein
LFSRNHGRTMPWQLTGGGQEKYRRCHVDPHPA